MASSTGNSSGGDGREAFNASGYDEAAIESWGSSGSGVTIQGNYLNVGADGSSDISTGTLSVDNSDYSAVLMLANSNSFTSLVIGGTGAGEGNVIANGPNVGAYIDNSNAVTFAGNTVHSNVSHGVRINGTSSTSVSLLQNSIYSNGGVGIDLGADGQTVNDSGDSDTGSNNLLNFPVLNGLYGDGTTSLRYEFTLDAPANTEGYRIEFFKTSVVNGTGYGDAETYIGALDTGAHAGGSVDYSGTFATDIAVSPDDIITVTATSKTGASSYGGTSEFALNNTMIAPYDYSDSPQTGTSYGTARHDIYSGFYLGSGVTGELSAYDSADASADNDDGTTLPSFSQSAAGTIDITVNGAGGYLQAWIDWNGDGDFLDTVDGILEVLATDIQDGGVGDLDATANGVIQIAFAVPPTATTNQTFGRFRWSTTSGLDSITDAADGEVEDYAFIITGNALLTASRSVAIYDPSSDGLYAVPGNDIVVTISATNIGGGVSDTDSIEFIDEVPTDISFYNGTTSSFGGAVVGWTESSTGLSFTVSSDVAYSNSGTRPATFADCTYTPSAGYDANVRYVCFNPKGQMAAGDPDPTFSVQYRAQIN